MNSFRRLVARARPFLALFLASVLCAIIVAFANFYPVYLIMDIIDKVLGAKDFAMLNIIALTLIAVMAVKGVASFYQSYSMAYIAERVVFDLRLDTFRHMQGLNLRFFEAHHSANLLSVIANDTLIIQQLMNNLIDLFVQVATFMGLMGWIFYLHWKLSLISLLIIPIVGLTVTVFSNQMKKFGFTIQTKIGDLAAVIGESFQGISIIKSFNLEEFDRGRFSEANQASFDASLECRRLESMTVPVVEFINTLALCVILYFGGSEVVAGRLTAGQMMSFLTALVSLFNPIKRLTKIYTLISQTVGASDRIFKILDNHGDREEVDPTAGEILNEVRGEVTFEGVSFSYESDDLVLQDINLQCQPGEVVALVGASGSGKTTLTRLLGRFFRPTRGRILIDGHDIANWNLHNLRSHIGIVPQDTFLFRMSVYENIRLGNPTASREEIERAATAANAMEFIERLPRGFDSLLGERGCNLSGGQKQRLSIARAILRNPRILILDEATSALDSESEILVQEALDRLMKGRTTFIIAHRLSTIVNSHKIIVIQSGRVVEFGNHLDLLNQKGPYHQLYSTQYGDRKSYG